MGTRLIENLFNEARATEEFTDKKTGWAQRWWNAHISEKLTEQQRPVPVVTDEHRAKAEKSLPQTIFDRKSTEFSRGECLA